jgi:hypothetical protein
MLGPLLRDSQTFLHTRPLVFDAHNVKSQGENHVEEKEKERDKKQTHNTQNTIFPLVFDCFCPKQYPPNGFHIPSTHTIPYFLRCRRINKEMLCMRTQQKQPPPPPPKESYPMSNDQSTTPRCLRLSPPHRSHPCGTNLVHGNTLKHAAYHHNLTL